MEKIAYIYQIHDKYIYISYVILQTVDLGYVNINRKANLTEIKYAHWLISIISMQKKLGK